MKFNNDHKELLQSSHRRSSSSAWKLSLVLMRLCGLLSLCCPFVLLLISHVTRGSYSYWKPIKSTYLHEVYLCSLTFVVNDLIYSHQLCFLIPLTYACFHEFYARASCVSVCALCCICTYSCTHLSYSKKTSCFGMVKMRLVGVCALSLGVSSWIFIPPPVGEQ
jgi:hypothetical protein